MRIAIGDYDVFAQLLKDNSLREAELLVIIIPALKRVQKINKNESWKSLNCKLLKKS